MPKNVRRRMRGCHRRPPIEPRPAASRSRRPSGWRTHDPFALLIPMRAAKAVTGVDSVAVRRRMSLPWCGVSPPCPSRGLRRESAPLQPAPSRVRRSERDASNRHCQSDCAASPSVTAESREINCRSRLSSRLTATPPTIRVGQKRRASRQDAQNRKTNQPHKSVASHFGVTSCLEPPSGGVGRRLARSLYVSRPVRPGEFTNTSADRRARSQGMAYNPRTSTQRNTSSRGGGNFGDRLRNLGTPGSSEVT